jgi:hypothetical protein
MSKVKVYHNVFHRNGYLWDFNDYGTVAPEGIDANVFKNNIVSANAASKLVSVNLAASAAADGNNPINENVFAHNLLHSDAGAVSFKFKELGELGTYSLSWYQENHPGNFYNNVEAAPDFVVDDPVQPDDFQLADGSGLVDAGGFLTRTKAAGSGTSVVVQDAGYFCDGFGVIPGDLVQIGANAPVRIAQVDYASNTLTLEATISWEADDAVSLPYGGAAPDIGAFEVQEDGLTAPEAPRDLVVSP